MARAENASIEQLWLDLQLAVRALVDDERERSVIAEVIQHAKRDWRGQFGRESHLDLLWSQNEQLHEDQERTVDLSFDEVVEQICEFTLYTIREMVSEIRAAIEGSVTSRLLEIFHFAELVDQAAHPQPAYRFMAVDGSVDVCAGEWSWDAVRPAAQRRWRLPQGPITLPEPWPNEIWLREVHVRGIQLGLPTQTLSRMCSLDAIDLASLFDSLSGADNVVDQAGDVENTPETAGTVPEERAASYLGLYVIDNEIGRQGYPQRIRLRSRLSLGLAETFIQAGTRPVTIDVLQDAWVSIGGNEENPEPNSVRAEITRLRPILGRLDVRISNAGRTLGWRLEGSGDPAIQRE
jgi:hypothetical protein